jgi:hypothetical protein
MKGQMREGKENKALFCMTIDKLININTIVHGGIDIECMNIESLSIPIAYQYNSA